MQFNDTSTKQGLLQDCEFRTNLGDGTITGDSALKAQFTRLLNIRYARTLGKLQILTGKDGAEDINYTDQQFSLFDIVSSQNDYQFLTDEDGNTISDITGVMLQAPTADDFVALERLALSDSDAMLVMSPNSTNTGTPTGYIEKNNTVFFDVIPDFSATSAGKLFYRLVPSYFTAGDTTKTPGFVEHFHSILSIGASLDWLNVNKPEQTVLIGACRDDLKDMSADLDSYVRQKNPTRAVMSTAQQSSR
jgi:hypothetical protein